MVLLLAVGFFGCGGPDATLLPAPSSTSSTTPASTTTSPDYSLIALEAFAGQTTTSAPRETGTTTVRGVVVGPDGPVPGAVVRIDRLVGGSVQRTDVTADENGGFLATDLPGGRFRVRGFLAPDLALLEPALFYVADGGDQEVRLTLERFAGYAAEVGTTPPQPMVGQGVNLAVRIVEWVVDGDGVARQVPVATMPVRLFSSGWTPLDADPYAVTDQDGVVVFQFRCDRVTTVTASITVGEERPVSDTTDPADPTTTTTTTTTTPESEAEPIETLSLDVPSCAPLPTTTTAPDDEPSPTTEP